MRDGNLRCNNADLVGDAQAAHCSSTVWFLDAILETDVLGSSHEVFQRPFCCWGSPGERDVEWFSSGERGMEENEEGEWEEHGGGNNLWWANKCFCCWATLGTGSASLRHQRSDQNGVCRLTDFCLRYLLFSALSLRVYCIHSTPTTPFISSSTYNGDHYNGLGRLRNAKVAAAAGAVSSLLRPHATLIRVEILRPHRRVRSSRP